MEVETQSSFLTTTCPPGIMECNITASDLNKSSFTTPLVALSIASCFLSICGGVIIIWTFVKIPDIRNSTRKLVTALTVADILTPFGYLMSAVYSLRSENKDAIFGSSLCIAQSAITTYSSMVSFFLTVVIAFHLFWTVYSRSSGTASPTFMLISNVISWGIPGIIIAVALSENMLGKQANSDAGTGPWCWVKSGDGKPTVAYMFVTGKAWEIQCYIYTAGLYLLLKLQLYLRYRYRTFREISPNLRDDDQNFLYVWLVLLLVRIWGTIRFFLALTMCTEDLGDFNKALLYLQALGDPSQAFCNCILFCVLDSKVRNKLRAMWRPFCACSCTMTCDCATSTCSKNRTNSGHDKLPVLASSRDVNVLGDEDESFDGGYANSGYGNSGHANSGYANSGYANRTIMDSTSYESFGNTSSLAGDSHTGQEFEYKPGKRGHHLVKY